MQALHQLTTADEPLLTKQSKRIVNTRTQHITHRKELRLPVLNDTAVGRNAYLTVRTSKQRINSLVARCSRSEVNQYLSRSSRQVLHIANLYLSSLICLEDTVYEGAWLGSSTGRLAVWYFSNSQRLIVPLLYLCTNTNRATSLAVVVL